MKRADIWLPISDSDEVINSLNELDKEFYKYEDNLTKLLDDFIKKNPLAKLNA